MFPSIVLVQGNINVLVFRVPEMAERLDSTGGIVPEFVNPKWADAELLVSKFDGVMVGCFRCLKHLMFVLEGNIKFKKERFKGLTGLLQSKIEVVPF